MIIYERKYSVNVFDTDHTGKLCSGAIFNYFQDLAGRHASLLGFGREHLMTNGSFWVLSRITVEIENLPLAWEEVTLRTWPRGTETIFALRDIELYDANGKRLAAAATSWVVVDYQTRKLQRPDKALSHLNSTFPDTKALSANAVKIPAMPVDNHSVINTKVSSGDLDVNLHVNNARYIQWVLNSYDPQFISTYTPHTIDVNYLSEAHFNDEISIYKASGKEDGTCFFHSLVRNNDSAELCRIRIKWRKEKL